MAVEQESRNSNIGTLILKSLISHAIEKNKQIILHARENAISFYLKMVLSLGKRHIFYLVKFNII